MFCSHSCTHLKKLKSTGNCNSDSDCQGELLCQQRNGWDLIYGCVGWGEEDVNYCREKTDDEKVGQLLISDVYSGIIMNSNEVVETEEEEPVAGGVVAGSTEVSPVDKRTPKVIKLMDDTSSYFVGYNGQQVTITKIDKETDEISLDGVVLNSDDTHVISNWKNSGSDLVLSASEMTDGYASIDIQLADPESPSSSPEASPTGGPSTLSPTGGPSTLTPTKVPTVSCHVLVNLHSIGIMLKCIHSHLSFFSYLSDYSNSHTFIITLVISNKGTVI